MKFALNGALTIGTWDGANIEMAQAIGEEHMFVFGLRADAGDARQGRWATTRAARRGEPAAARGARRHRRRRLLARRDPGRYRDLVDGLLQRDPYMLLADFADYVATQSRVDALYASPAAWAERRRAQRRRHGQFLVDRTIREYRREIWAPR